MNNDFKFRWTSTRKTKNVSKPFWTDEKLLNISTIEQALEDYRYGYPTSFNGDTGKVISINKCYVCGEQIEQSRINGKRWASNKCSKCVMITDE